MHTGSWKTNFSVSLWILCKEINCLYYFCSNINVMISNAKIWKDKWYLFEKMITLWEKYKTDDEFTAYILFLKEICPIISSNSCAFILDFAADRKSSLLIESCLSTNLTTSGMCFHVRLCSRQKIFFADWIMFINKSNTFLWGLCVLVIQWILAITM